LLLVVEAYNMQSLIKAGREGESSEIMLAKEIASNITCKE
jgi:hypothetical protein